MTRTFYIFFFLATTIITFAQRLEIYGSVFSKGDSLPISEAKVRLYNEKDSVLETIFSDEKGNFIFKRTKPGVYHLTVSKKKYLMKELTNLKFAGYPNCALRIPLEGIPKGNSPSQ